ncbi:hypothetical protein AK830_g12434 [Neonectria ditissima]|uniref:Bud22 domain-containing protein n=1 Tax=Neonectria ditissima TaxID=78410 RepID=A0A0P7APK3_9HYPO|nr:hypothetical protein AK830_g12434 [Neonectria ditissima]
MPKRKRSGEPSVQEKLNKLSDDISRALKAAKGFERQRLSKRIRDDGITPEKKERLDREITVLKSLDLHQTARAHMYASLLKIKSVAESEDLPEEIRRGLAKPDLSEEERVALHNVTSGLYNRDNVKKAVGGAVAAVCEMLNVPVPQKGKRVRKSKQEKDEQSEEQPKEQTEDQLADKKVLDDEVHESVEEDDESEFQGFSDDEAGPALDLDDDEKDAEEDEFSQYDHLLGSSSDEDEEEFNHEKFERYKGREKVNLDDISLSGSAADSDSDSEPEDLSSASSSPSPPPAKKKKKEKKTPTARPTGSTFLPSLMGGYISGSESASDVDVAPAKKRRGQRQRQAIWEKKFGGKAKHLQQPAKSGRDSGWDSKRGAVDGGDGGQRTPWKKGIRNPLARGSARTEPEAEKPPPKKDDEGPLHPSWQARKKAKEQGKTVAFAGSKITFD